jgi:hypothetical protein
LSPTGHRNCRSTVAGQSLNGTQVCPEPDGAEIVDLAVYPDDQKPGAFSSYYPDGAPQLFDEIEYAVSDAKARHGVRVFINRTVF